MSAYISSLDYVLNNVIASKKLTNFNVYDTHTNNRRLIGTHEGNSPQSAQREFNDLISALIPGEKVYCIFSEKNREEKRAGNTKDDQTFYFVKQEANQGQAIGAQPQAQGANREDLINDRWTMELKYRDEIRDLKDELRRTKEAQEPKWYEALLANQLNKPNGAGELAALAGHFIGMVKGNPQAAIVNGTDTQPAHINTEVEGRVNAAITSLFQFDKEFLEVLEGLQRFTAKPENASTYNIIKQQLLNS